MNFLKAFDFLSQSVPRTDKVRPRADWPFILSLFVLANYLIWVVWYLFLSNYFDHVEPTISAISWVFINGKPLYHPLDSMDQYNMVYGPVLFFTNGLLMKIFSPAILTSKLGGAIFSLISILGLCFAVQKYSERRTGLMAGAVLVLIYCAFWPFTTFITRADALILGLVAVGLTGLHARSALPAALITLLAAAISINVKIHSAMYFFPIWAIMLTRFGLVPVLFSGFGTLAVATLPFLLFPEKLPFEHFSRFLLDVGPIKYGINPMFYKNAINIILYQFIPFLLFLGLFRKPGKIIRENWFVAGVFILSFLVSLIIGSRPGAGKFHLLPLSIPLIYWMACLLIDHGKSECDQKSEGLKRISGLISLVVVFLILAMVPVHGRLIKLSTWNGRDNAAIEDLRQIMKNNPGKQIAMGIGDTERNHLTWYLPILVFAGNDYSFDLNTIMELKISHLMDQAPGLWSALESCKNDIWLIPRGSTPFNHTGVYDGKVILNDRFRETFNKSYSLESSSTYYDLWRCARNQG